MEIRQTTVDPFAAMNRSQREEIARYRWIESEKAGYDIGWARAQREWMDRHWKAWQAALRTSGCVPPVTEILWSQQEEIERFKWLESERRGVDIGWADAVREWQVRHYEAWKRFVTLTNEPVRTTDALPIPQRHRAARGPLPVKHRAKLSRSLKSWAAKRRRPGTKK